MRILSFVAQVLLITCLVVAEDDGAKRGVLADGTPFRTDAEGNQIIDYIAELEHSVDSLNRRVHGLEVEVEAKQGVIERLQARAGLDESVASTSRHADSRIVERDLVDSSSARVAFGGSQEGSHSAPAAEIPKVEEETTQVTKISLNNVKLQEVQAENRTLISAKETLQRRAEVVESERQKIQSQLASDRTRYETELDERNQRIHELEQLLSAKNQDFAKKENEIAQLRKVRLTEGSNSVGIIQSPSVAEPVAPRVDVERITMPSTQVREPIAPEVSKKPIADERPVEKDWRSFVKPSEEPRASMSQARLRALETTKSMMRTEINNLRGIIAARDSLYERYKDHPSPNVQFTLSKLVSKRGMTLDDVAERLPEASTISVVSELKRDVAEIRRIAQDDSALIKRLGKF